MTRQYSLNEFNLTNFLDEITNEVIRNKIYACIHKDNILTLYLTSDFTSEENTEVQTYVDNHNPNPASELRIFRSLEKDKNPLTSDFSILGFRKKAPHYDRGRKVRAEYHCATNDDIIVIKTFSDIYDVDGNLYQLQIKFDWYCEDGTIGLTKTEIAEEYSKAKAKTVLRERRNRSIDFLISEGEGTAIEPIMDILINHYENVKDRYIKYGNSEFSDAINNETDTTINNYLNLRVPFASDNNFTVPIKESILYQIGALDEASLLATLVPVG